MWNYINYMIQISSQCGSITKENATDQIIIKKFRVGDISWMPYQKSISLQREQKTKVGINMDGIVSQTLLVQKSLEKIRKYQTRLLLK